MTIRLLDPPLHEFLPHDAEGQQEVAEQLGVSAEKPCADAVDDLHEINPMLGLRGCRLGIVYPEITEMQARAIFEAACEVKDEGINVHPEIMIPLVGTKKELDDQVDAVRAGGRRGLRRARHREVEYLVGTMIEIPRAALTADKIAETAEFFSFGTNDLTQMTFGVSPRRRRQVPAALPAEGDPGRRPVRHARPGGRRRARRRSASSRAARPARTSSSASAASMAATPRPSSSATGVGMDYVSCSPFRVPVARLAAAQAAIEERGDLELEK